MSINDTKQKYVNGRFQVGPVQSSNYISSKGSRDVEEKGGLQKELKLCIGAEGATVLELKINGQVVDFEQSISRPKIVSRNAHGVFEDANDPNDVIRMDYGDDRIR